MEIRSHAATTLTLEPTEASLLQTAESGTPLSSANQGGQPIAGASAPQFDENLRDFRPANAHFAMLRQLNASSEDFANSSVALTKALQARRSVVVAVNMNPTPISGSTLTCWTCTHDEQGIELRPIDTGDFDREAVKGDVWADQLLGTGKRGDALVVCDPWGDHELLCWALRLATRREIATISITTERPNLLSVLSHYSIRVPRTEPWSRDPVITVLGHLVQTAGVGVIPAHKRATGPLRALPFE